MSDRIDRIACAESCDMEYYRVELTITLHGKVKKWSKEDQIVFSAFVQSLREFSFDTVLASSNCSIERGKIDSTGQVVELWFWMKARMDYGRFVLREPDKGLFILGDR